MSTLKKNFFYQSLFQLVKILIPIITIPIISKALGPGGIGAYNYTFSIVQYFVLFAGLGVATYGNREIAISWQKKENFSKTFLEIFIFKAVIAILLVAIYFILILFLPYKIIFLIQGINIISVIFDVSWFFMGIEDFKKTSIVSLSIQIVNFVLIIIFIKTPDDLGMYTFFQSMSNLLSQFFILAFLKDYIRIEKIKFSDCFKHVNGSIKFFIPQIAIMFYTNINKTLLGVFLGTTAVGFYTNSLQINNVFITVITTLDIVLLPHMSSLFAKDNIDQIIKLIRKTINLQLFFSIPIMFGILTVFDKLVPWFFGESFLFINKVIPLFSVLVVIIPLGMSVSRQYLMPIGEINVYNKSVLIGAVINILFNVLLIPSIGFFGVVVSNILAEAFVTLVRVLSFCKSTKFKFDFKKIGIYFISGVIMCAFTRYLTNSLKATMITNALQVVIAVPIYFALTSLFRANPLFSYVNARKIDKNPNNE